MTPHKPTGKTRYRLHKRLFQKPLLVLQFEYEGFVPEFTGGSSVDGCVRRYFVDATVEMLQMYLKEEGDE